MKEDVENRHSCCLLNTGEIKHLYHHVDSAEERIVEDAGEYAVGRASP